MMFAEVYAEVKRLLPDYRTFAYLRNIDNAPHNGRFASLYLLGTDIDFHGKKTARLQLLVAHPLESVSENTLDAFEKEVYRITRILMENLPITEFNVEFGVSDAYMYAYIKFEVRFK